ncbi:MAG: hypothetical protein ACFFBD_13935 [Candidatus Hodarchaeota archaeon]
MEKVVGIKKTILITEYISCPRCQKSIFPEKEKDQGVCSNCNIIVVKPGVEMIAEETITAEVEETTPELEEKTLNQPITSQPVVKEASEAFMGIFNRLGEISQNIAEGKVKQILITNYLCCPKCEKSIAPMKESEPLHLCTSCQLLVKRPKT